MAQKMSKSLGKSSIQQTTLATTAASHSQLFGATKEPAEHFNNCSSILFDKSQNQQDKSDVTTKTQTKPDRSAFSSVKRDEYGSVKRPNARELLPPSH